MRGEPWRPEQRVGDRPSLAVARLRRIRKLALGRYQARLRRREREVLAIEWLGAHREKPSLAQSPVLGWVLRPALNEREVKHQAGLRVSGLLHVVHVRRAKGGRGHRVHAPRPVPIEHDSTVRAGRLERVKLLEPILEVLALGPDSADELVERELVVDLGLPLD